jgi:predicted RND superfamily exporter protein
MNWDLATNILFLVFLVIILVILIVMLVLALNTSPPEAMDMNFVMHDTRTNRNNLTEINTIRVRYRYSSVSNAAKFPNQENIEKQITEGLLISASIPQDSKWEDVINDICQNIYHDSDITGVSLQFEIENDNFITFTKGYVSAIDDF